MKNETLIKLALIFGGGFGLFMLLKPKVGDKILIPSYEGYRLSKDQTKDGKEYRIILDRNILAIQINEEICQ